MKFDPKKDMGDHEEMDENEDEGQGDDKPPVKGDKAVKGGKKYSKSENTSEDDLQKSLDRLDEFATSGDAPSRKEQLLEMAKSEDLSKSDNAELFELLGGAPVPTVVESTPSDTITKSLTDDNSDDFQKALDVSDYLDEHHQNLVKSLGVVGEEIAKADHRRQEFNLILAKAVSDIGSMVKGMSESLGMISGQPARAPKSAGAGARTLEKSFANQPGGGEEQLSKSQVLDTLDTMMQESMEKGMNGRTVAGEDILLASSKYEQTHMISPSMLGEVRNRRKAATH